MRPIKARRGLLQPPVLLTRCTFFAPESFVLPTPLPKTTQDKWAPGAVGSGRVPGSDKGDHGGNCGTPRGAEGSTMAAVS